MTIKDRLKFREFESLGWRDAKRDLIELGRLQARIALETGISPSVKNLRDRDLRQYLEWRQAALFAYFIGKARLDCPVQYAMCEAEDYDCVYRWVKDAKCHYTPIQLKEVVPTHLNESANLDSVIAKLSRYKTKSATVAAIQVNQTGEMDFQTIESPETGLREIWLYGSLSKDQSLWFIYGDLLATPEIFEVEYPRPSG